MTRLEIATDVENISNVKTQRDLVNRSIQHALERVFQFYDWPYYIQDKGVIKTVAVYDTGTVEVTNGSKNLTFSGSTLTSAMAGRKIRFNGENEYYRIYSVNTEAGTAVLEHEYSGTTDSSATFAIYQDEYRLSADVDKYKTVRNTKDGIVLFDTHPTDFDKRFPAPNSYSSPLKSVMVGTRLDTYSTGTVTASSKTITGSGTSWTSVEGLGRMSKFRIGSNVYTVKSVDSDTKLTVYETVTTVGSATAYEIMLNNIRIQLYSIPSESQLLYYRYFRVPELLANDYDIPDMPHSFHWVLMYGALSIMFLQKGDIQKAQQECEARFLDGLNMMRMKLGSFSPDRIYKVCPQGSMGANLNGLETSNFSRRYSMPA